MKNKVFAKGLSFPKIFIFFLLFAFIGTLYEEVLTFFQYGAFSNRQALIYGPFNPIYGLGAALIILFLAKKGKKRSFIKTFLYVCLISGITEYLFSFIFDFFFGIKFWDYSNDFLNINGRVTLIYILGWGILGTVLVKWIYPFLSKWIEKIPYYLGQTLYIIFLSLIIVDMFLTYTAFGRMALRHQGKDPMTPIGVLYDKVYSDDYLYKKFPAIKLYR